MCGVKTNELEETMGAFVAQWCRHAFFAHNVTNENTKSTANATMTSTSTFNTRLSALVSAWDVTSAHQTFTKRIAWLFMAAKQSYLRSTSTCRSNYVAICESTSCEMVTVLNSHGLTHTELNCPENLTTARTRTLESHMICSLGWWSARNAVVAAMFCL